MAGKSKRGEQAVEAQISESNKKEVPYEILIAQIGTDKEAEITNGTYGKADKLQESIQIDLPSTVEEHTFKINAGEIERIDKNGKKLGKVNLEEKSLPNYNKFKELLEAEKTKSQSKEEQKATKTKKAPAKKETTKRTTTRRKTGDTGRE